MKKIEVMVSGRVQGVGFRYFVLKKAIELSIKGYVRNTLDGKVEVLAIASDNAMEIFLAELHRGSARSIVKSVEIVELAAVGNYENFRIKY